MDKKRIWLALVPFLTFTSCATLSPEMVRAERNSYNAIASDYLK